MKSVAYILKHLMLILLEYEYLILANSENCPLKRDTRKSTLGMYLIQTSTKCLTEKGP